MTEKTSTETPATETETVVEPQEAPKPAKPTETVEFWKAKSREQEARAKANASAADRLKAFEDRDKTEAQKMQDRAEAAEKRATDLESHAVRLEVAALKGLTPAQAKRLLGTTREELEADADDLLDTFKPAPVEDPRDAVATSLDLGTRSAPTTALTPAVEFQKMLQRQMRVGSTS